ncbi:MAG TPA: serine hydrolase domain-containing protein [Candidatus Limnocylindria bacterium]|nr:serine hydrolase domain-containing protein [Candidatus Limnocylindria bacterium]
MSGGLAALRVHLERRMPELVVPGVALGLVHEGREEYLYRGVTSVPDPLPVDEGTRFQIGSTTKTMTATVALRLAEQGALDLDAPVRTYLPGFRLADEGAASRVTLRHLFTHSGGWLGDYFEDTGRGDDALAKVVEKLADLPQLTAVGAEWHYGNSGFYVAGRVIEVVTGKTFEQAMRELLLEPLGMADSVFFAEDAIAFRVAVGHLVRDERAEVARRWALPRNAHAAGGITSTARDQIRYARFHLGDGTVPDGARLVSAEGLRAMRDPIGPRGAVGLSWWLRTVDGTRIASHGGTTAGQQAEFVLVPERGFGITVLTNSSRGHALGRELVRLALREYCALDDREAETRTAGPGQLEAIAGRYEIARGQLELRVEGGELLLTLGPRPGVAAPPNGWPPFPPPARCGVVGDDELVVLEGPGKGSRVEVLRDGAGAIAWVRFGLRLYAPESRAHLYPAHGGGLVT